MQVSFDVINYLKFGRRTHIIFFFHLKFDCPINEYCFIHDRVNMIQCIHEIVKIFMDYFNIGTCYLNMFHKCFTFLP